MVFEEKNLSAPTTFFSLVVPELDEPGLANFETKSLTVSVSACVSDNFDQRALCLDVRQVLSVCLSDSYFQY